MSNGIENKANSPEKIAPARSLQSEETKNGETDNVDEASRQSFPASDPPAWFVSRKKENQKR